MTRDLDLHERFVTLAENLLEATRAGKVSWAITDNETKFLYAGTSSSVTIEFYDSRDGEENILSLLNSRGTVVDSLATEYHRTSDEAMEAADWNDTLEDLYSAARRVAHNVDEAIDSMLSDIEKGTPSPPQPKLAKKKVMDDPWSDEPPF